MTQQTKTTIEVARRDVLGKKVRALRREGFTPANVYGHSIESIPVQIGTDELRRLLKGKGRNEIVYVQVEGEERPTFIKEIQRNPVTDQILHLDFFQISLKEKVRLSVPLHFQGLAPAIDTYGGIITHQLNDVMVEALPTAIPSSIDVDVSGLNEIGDAIHVSDLIVPEGAEILNEPESSVARVDLPAAEKAEEATEGEVAEGEEGAPAAEGEPGEGGGSDNE